MNLKKHVCFVRRLAVTSLAVGLFAGCSTVVEHPDFARRGAGVRHIAVVTPNVEFHCQAPKSRQVLPDKEAELRTNLLAAITRELSAKGFTVAFPEWKALATTSNINEALAASQAIDRAVTRSNFFVSIRFQPPRKRATPEQKEDVRLLGKLAHADTIAFLQLNGYTNTLAERDSVGTRNFFGFLFAVSAGAAGPIGATVGGRGNFEPLHGGIWLQLMLAEAATGEPLWANAAASTDEHPKLEFIVKELTKPLPGSRGQPVD